MAHRYHSGTSRINVTNCYFIKNCVGIRIGRYGNSPLYALYDIKVSGYEFESNFYALSFHGGHVSHINSVFKRNKLKNSDSSNIMIFVPLKSVGLKLNLGNLENNDTIDDGMNHILGSVWSIYNFSYDTIYAQGNLWDYQDSTLIDSKIYDDNENPALGKVDFKYFYRAGRIDRDLIVKGKFLISGDIIIPESVKLKIIPPAEIIFAKNFDILRQGNDTSKAELIIYGDLKIEGEGKTTFTSDGFIKEKGDFYGIVFKERKRDEIMSQVFDEKSNIYFRNTRIEYSNKGVEFLRDKKLKLKDLEISNSNYGVYFKGRELDLGTSVISLCDTGIYLLKGKGHIKETNVKENEIGVLYK